MPGTRCTVAVCNNSVQRTKNDPSLQHIKYHSFPKDKELKKRWVLLCHRKGKWKPEGCRVCSDHFKPDDYVRDLQAELLNLPPKQILKKTAVPSLNLGRKDSAKRLALAEKRFARRERRTNKKLVDQLLLKKYDEDCNTRVQYINMSLESNDVVALGESVPKIEKLEELQLEETGTFTINDQQEQNSEEFIVEYLEDADDMLIQESVDEPESKSTVFLDSCSKCDSFENLKNEHDLLKHQYNALTVENHELSLKLGHSQESVQLHKSKLKEVLKEVGMLKEKRAKEHMVVQSKCENGKFQLVVKSPTRLHHTAAGGSQPAVDMAMPGRQCMVAVCTNSPRKTKRNPSLQQIKYHSFPKDKDLKKQWVLLCNRKGKWEPEDCRVCSDHFKPDDYVRDLQAELLNLPPKQVLKKTAVPSLNLGRKDSPKRSALAEKRFARRERRTNKKLVDQLLLKKYDQDCRTELQYINIPSESNDAVAVDISEPKIKKHKLEETGTFTINDQQEQNSEEFIVEYLEDADDMLIQESVDEPESKSTVLLDSCSKCDSFENLKNEHDLLKNQYNALTVENRELSLKLEHSQESVQLHKSKLKEVLKELHTLKDNRAKEHMVVQSKCENGMYEVFVVMNNEGKQ